MTFLQDDIKKDSSESQKNWREQAKERWTNDQKQIEQSILGFVGVRPLLSTRADEKNLNPYYPKFLSILILGSDLSIYLAKDDKDPEGLQMVQTSSKLGEQTLQFKWKDKTVESITKKADGTFEYDTSSGKGKFKVEKGKILKID